MDKLILFFGGLLTFLAGMVLVVLSLTGILGVPGAETHTALARWLLPLTGTLLVLFGAFVLALPRRLKQRQESFVVAQTENGEMSISVRALEDIVRRCAYQQQGLSLREVHITRQRDLVQVQLRVAGEPGTDLPQAVAQLQKDIQREMLSSAGIKTGDIRITVDSAPQGRIFERRRMAPAAASHSTGTQASNTSQPNLSSTQEEKKNAGT